MKALSYVTLSLHFVLKSHEYAFLLRGAEVVFLLVFGILHLIGSSLALKASLIRVKR